MRNSAAILLQIAFLPRFYQVSAAVHRKNPTVANGYVCRTGQGAPSVWDRGGKHLKAIVKTKRREDGTLEFLGSEMIATDVLPNWRASARS